MAPSGWRVDTIGELCDVATGGTPSRRRSDFWGGDIPWMSSGEIHQRRVTDTKEAITDAGLAASNANWMPKNAVMVALNGQGKTRGTAAILERPMTCNQSLAAILPNDSRLVPYYLLHYLSAKYAAIRRLTGDGGRNGLNLKHVRSIRVAYPYLPEQRKIAATLSSVDDAIEKTQAVIDQVQVVKRGLMQELLTRGLPGRHTRFKQTEIGEIPTEWTAAAIGDCASIGNGTTPSKKRGEYWDGGTISWLPTGKVNDRIISAADTCVTERAVSETSLRLLPMGTLLIAMIGQGKTRGKTAYLNIEACVNQNFAYVIPYPQISSWFLFYVLEHQYDELRNSGRGSNQDALNCRIIRKFRVPLPSPDEQIKIAEILKAVDKRSDVEQQRVELLGGLKSALMSVLLTGELRVTSDPETA